MGADLTSRYSSLCPHVRFKALEQRGREYVSHLSTSCSTDKLNRKFSREDHRLTEAHSKNNYRR